MLSSRRGQKGLSVTIDSGFAGGRRIAFSDNWRRRSSLSVETNISRLSAACRHDLVPDCATRFLEPRSSVPAVKGVLPVMQKKWYLKDQYADFPPVPFGTADYVLCAIAFFLTGIASSAQIAGIVASMHR